MFQGGFSGKVKIVESMLICLRIANFYRVKMGLLGILSLNFIHKIRILFRSPTALDELIATEF
jgi:hypothetical protein